MNLTEDEPESDAGNSNLGNLATTSRPPAAHDSGGQMKNLSVVGGCLLLGCSGGHGPEVTRPEVETMIAAALQARSVARVSDQADGGPGSPNLRAVTSTSLASQSHKLVEPRCISAEGRRRVQGTANMLLRLEELMVGFDAPETEAPPTPPQACLTTLAMQNDPIGARLEKGLAQDFEQRRRQAMEQARRRHEQFDATAQREWIWTTMLQPGTELRIVPARYGCTDSRFTDLGPSSCPNEFSPSARWVQVRPPTLTLAEPERASDDRGPARADSPNPGRSGETELTRRVREAGDVHPEQDQYCSVLQAEIASGEGRLHCVGPVPEQEFVVLFEPEAGAATGPLGNVGVGDLVKIRTPRLIWRLLASGRSGDRSGTWQFSLVPPTGLEVVERSTCCNAPAADGNTPDGGVR